MWEDLHTYIEILLIGAIAGSEHFYITEKNL